MGLHSHKHSAECIRPDGSYCRELEAAIGAPPRKRRWERERNVDPAVLPLLEEADEWHDPAGDEATGSEVEFVYINGSWLAFPKEPVDARR